MRDICSVKLIFKVFNNVESTVVNPFSLIEVTKSNNFDSLILSFKDGIFDSFCDYLLVRLDQIVSTEILTIKIDPIENL